MSKEGLASGRKRGKRKVRMSVEERRARQKSDQVDGEVGEIMKTVTRTASGAEGGVRRVANARQKEFRARQKKILDVLGKLGEGRTGDDELVFRGNEFVIPETMNVKDAIAFLVRYEKTMNKITAFNRTYNYRAWDGAFAMQIALKQVFGTAGLGKDIQTMFGKEPPQLKTINIGVEETAQIPWGHLDLPMLNAVVKTGATRDPELGVLFSMTVEAPRKYKAHIEGLFDVVQQVLEQQSIYKGKAIDGDDDPNFIDLSGVDHRKVIYNEDTLQQLSTNIWSLIRHSKHLLDHGIPLKRAVLLEGPYGSGKTLGAYLSAQVAVNDGWTFIYCRPKDNLYEVMATARLYQPAVVFFEDIDTMAGIDNDEDRDSISKLLDLFDGLTAKNTQLVIVMTTNHVEKLRKSMMRPGRLDAVIHIGELNPEQIIELVKVSVREDVLDKSTDWTRVQDAMEGFLPAFIKEAADRAVRYAIDREDGPFKQLSTDDFVGAANGLRAQLKMMEDAQEDAERTPFDEALKKTVREAVHGTEIIEKGQKRGEGYQQLASVSEQ